MGEVSANPGVMREYFLDGCEQLAQWQPELDRLREALEGVWQAFTDGHVPAEYCAGFNAQTADDLVGQCEQVKEDIRYSDQNVYDVAEAVAEAGGAGTGTNPAGEASWPDSVLTVPDSALQDVGPAARFEAAIDEAGPDAETGLELLAEAGALDALEGGLDDEELADIALGIDSEGDLARWLEETGPKLEDPLYAAAFYNALGAEGLEGLSAVFLAAGGVADINNGAGWQEASAPGSGDWARHVADPFIEGLAGATTTGLLDQTVLFGLDPVGVTSQVTGGSGNAELPDGIDSGEVDLPDGLLTGIVTENDRQAAAIMFSAEGELYDPWIFGQAAREILGAGQQYGEFPPYGDEFATEADALMMRGLAENPAAAYFFVMDDTGEPVDAYLNMLIDPDPGLGYLGDPYAGFNNEHIWLDTPEGRAGTLPEMWELWSATAYNNILPDRVHEFRDFDGNVIDGHPWRNPDLLLGDDRFLESAGYDGWYDPTLGEEHSLYTMWAGPPGSELEPLGFFYDNRPERMSNLIDIAPFVGQAKALYETFTAHDPVTGEDTNRWLALTGFVVGAGLWGAGTYMGGAPLLAWTRNQLRNHPAQRPYSVADPSTAQTMNIPRHGSSTDWMPSYRSDHDMPDRPIDSSLLDALAEASMVNPSGHGYNCAFVTVAAHNRLSGNWNRMLEAPPLRIHDTGDLAAALDGTYVPVHGTHVVESNLRNRGHGAQSVLHIEWDSGDSHVINVFNHRGTIYYYDAQVGRWIQIADYLEHGKVIGVVVPGYD